MTAGLRRPQIAGALCSGILLVLVFPGADLGWLAWICLVPLLLGIRRATPGQAFRLGMVTGVVAYGGLMAWIRLFGLPAWILLSVGMAAFTGVFAAVATALARHYTRWGDGVWLWIAPICWTAVEVLRSIGPLGFPWGLLGLTQYRTPAVLAVAPYAGALGIGFLIVLTNAVVAAVIAARHVSRSVVVAVVLVVAFIAAARLSPPPQGSQSRVVAAIQPNVAPTLKDDQTTAVSLLDDLLERTREARAAGAEVIVYPETALPLTLGATAGTRLAIAHAAGGAVVVAGAYLPGPQNGVVVLGPAGETLGRYAKRRLVPFGEAGVRAGVDAHPIPTPAGRIGLAICYESAFTDVVRPLAIDGADVLALLTNDGWFGTSAGPAQHAAHAVLRAAETRRSLIRAANTGTSMLIRPEGIIIARQRLGTAGVLVADLPVGGATTPHTRWGWLFGPLALAVVVAATAPLGWGALRAHPAEAVRLILALGAPGVVFVLTHAMDDWGGGPRPGASLLVLAAAALVARGRLIRWRGAWLSAAVSLGVTIGLVAAMRAAYRQYGFDLPIGPGDNSWAAWLWPSLAAGVAIEAWLRGAVFGAALPVGGWPLAVALSTGLGVLLSAGQTQEVAFWHLFTGVAFGAVRLWTRDAVGLGPARGLGDAVVMGLAGLR